MKTGVTTTLLLLLVVLAMPRDAFSAQPNLVIFLADDAGWGDYSHSGNQQVSTPNIDSIANGGVSLDRFYVCSVCSPTRRVSHGALSSAWRRTWCVDGAGAA